MTNLNAKFEVSTRSPTTNYTKDNAKCRKWAGCWWLGVTQSHRRHNHSIEHTQLYIIFDFNTHYASTLLYRFRVRPIYSKLFVESR